MSTAVLIGAAVGAIVGALLFTWGWCSGAKDAVDRADALAKAERSKWIAEQERWKQ